MNILFLHDKPSGGAGESLLQLIHSLKKEHSCCVVFTGKGFLKPKFDDIKNEVPQYYHPSAGSWLLNRDFGFSWLNYIRLAIRFPKNIPLIRAIIQRAKQYQSEVIYSNTIYLLEGAIAAKYLGIPHIWQVRELFDLDYYKYCIPKSRVAKVLGYFSKKIVVNSNRTREVIERFKGDLSKTKVIHNIVNHPIENQDIREHLNLSSNAKLVCILGWLTPNKRIEDFIAVANQFSDPNLKFLIIGGFGGREWYNQKIKQLLAESSNKANIIHTGILPNAVNYLASIDLLLCSCYTESFGRTVGEALIAGTPAIGIKGSATQELIQHKRSGFIVEKGDIQTMAMHVRDLLENDPLRKEMGQNGKLFIQENFSTTSILPLYHQLFKEVLN